MTFAIFGISNDGLNLVVNLLILMLVVVWLALIVFTFLDARRRVSDPFLVACATVASFIPYIGTAVYAILRPPEFLEDAHERELEIKAAELRSASSRRAPVPSASSRSSAATCAAPSASAGSRTLRQLRQARRSRWSLCPYCETAIRSRERSTTKRASSATGAKRQAAATAEKGPGKSPRRGRARGRRQPGAAAQTTIPKEPRT